jgi:hypothetical protein
MHILLAQLTLLAWVSCVGFGSFATAMVPRRDADLAPLWTRLDAARKYRHDEQVAAGRVARKSYADLLKPTTGYPSKHAEFLSIAEGFAAFSDEPARRDEAIQGMQEAFNEVMAGQTLLGNDRLLKGLRTRFRGPGDPEGRDPRELLEESGAEFRRGIDAVVSQVLLAPETFRAGGGPTTDYPFWVENTPPSGQGELVENEYYRLTELGNRYGLALNEAAKRRFFFAADQPGGAQGGAYQAELERAVAGFKQAGQSTYLLTAVLAAAQNEKDFRNNNGEELERELSDAQLLFDSIRQGVNPLELVGDKIPEEAISEVLCKCRNSMDVARASETGVVGLARAFDEDATALVSELQEQRKFYAKRLFDQMGAVPVTATSTKVKVATFTAPVGEYELADPNEREAYLALARNPTFLYESDADIPNAYKAFDGARKELQIARKQLENIVQQVRIEEERSGKVALLTLANGAQLGALEVAKGIAVSSIPDVGTETTFDLSAAIEGLIDGGKEIVASINAAAISNTDSEATIKNLLLEQATQLLAIERATIAVRELEAAYTALIGDQEWNLESFLNVRGDLATAYFTNPAYGLALDHQRRAADQDFERALGDCFEAARAMEYEWAERISNPVKRAPPNAAVALGPGLEAVVRSESVFAIRSAGANGSPRPALDTFYLALAKWDSLMTQYRFPATGEGEVRLSLKRQILGFGSPDEEFNRLGFRDFIAKHRVRGRNSAKPNLVIEFPIQIANRRVLPLPFSPNVKVGGLDRNGPKGLRVTLRSVPGRSVFEPGAFENPAEVKVYMFDKALLRTFAATEADDDVLTLDLPRTAINLEQHPFQATVQAGVDDRIAGLPNRQLENKSPAVTRWRIEIDMNANANLPLRLEYLDDIELTLNYREGRPPNITFPTVCTN